MRTNSTVREIIVLVVAGHRHIARDLHYSFLYTVGSFSDNKYWPGRISKINNFSGMIWPIDVNYSDGHIKRTARRALARIGTVSQQMTIGLYEVTAKSLVEIQR